MIVLLLIFDFILGMMAGAAVIVAIAFTVEKEKQPKKEDKKNEKL